ncbi:plant cysteine oxidase 2-like [Daucus carota subsp. sativus]|uniref:plant cysteine oxidase 2-like n=1 Tax=Daucus carota subsp. sativus TaxID=79200 RepID=UPI0030830B88
MFVFLDPWIIVAELARLCLVTAYKVLWVFHWLCFEGFFSSVRWGFSREFANGALSAEARLAKVKVDADFIAPCDTSILYPTDGGNMHCFTVVTQCAVLDVLGPPYNDAEGRHCAYYIEHPLDHISDYRAQRHQTIYKYRR